MNNARNLWSQLLVLILLLTLSSLACNLTNQINAPTVTPTATAIVDRPIVDIASPPNSSEIVIGEEVLIVINAQDNTAVTRIELKANGFIVGGAASEVPEGSRQLSTIVTWVPSEVGPAFLQAIAYRGDIPSEPDQILINVRASAAQLTATAPPPVGMTQIPTDDPTCRARVTANALNFRTGPAINYPILRVLPLGEVVQIAGRLPDNSWWQVRDAGLAIGWLSSAYTSQSGDCSQVPVAVPPPSPTPRPATVTPLPTATATLIPGTATPVPTATPMIPDLVVQAIVGPTVLQLNNTGTVGATYTVRVHNQGTGDSGTFRTSFRQSDGTLQVMPIVVNLAPNQSADLTVDVLFAASDTYQLAAIVDSASEVVENDEGNNVRTLDVTVTTAPQSN